MALKNILSYPHSHPYINRLHGVAGNFVHINESLPQVSNFYNPTWLHAHINEWGIAHFHFGWEQYSLEQVEEVLSIHQMAGKQIVVTIHDTRSPHTSNKSVDEAYIRLLCRYATQLITLTPSAKRAIEETYHRTSAVIPHGPLMSERKMIEARQLRRKLHGEESNVVYIHVRSGRKNLDWESLLLRAPEVENNTGYKLLFGITRNTAAHEYVTKLDTFLLKYIKISSTLSDEELNKLLIKVKGILMPYAWGSHSGLLELAHDIGLSSLIYDTGHYHDQSPTALLPYSKNAQLQVNILCNALLHIPKEFNSDTVKKRMELLDIFKSEYKKVYDVKN